MAIKEPNMSGTWALYDQNERALRAEREQVQKDKEALQTSTTEDNNKKRRYQGANQFGNTPVQKGLLD